MRVLHFSDLHLGLGLRHIPLRDLWSKRLLGTLNLLLGRRRLFDDVARKVSSLAAFARDEGVDLVIFSGDYTALATEAELRAARAAVQPLVEAPAGYVGVPGNHDLYAPDVLHGRRFERHFGDTLHSDLPELRVDGAWPLVRLAGGDVAVVAVNSARPTPLWSSNGGVPADQLRGLRDVLADARVRERFVFIVTHYAPRRADGRLLRRDHRMLNADDFLRACATAPRAAILCGHVHHAFRLALPDLGPEIFCAGSATIDGREGAWVYDLRGGRLEARLVRWNGERYLVEGGREVPK